MEGGASIREADPQSRINNQRCIQMLRAVVAAIAFSLCASLGLDTAQGQIVVETDGGPVRGVAAGSVTMYLGIPYAAPPVGELRWRPPRAPRPWSVTRDADTFGARCPQTAAVGEFSAPSSVEDCLFLNVFVPSGTVEGSKLAVMFWIPGGGFFAGASNDY